MQILPRCVLSGFAVLLVSAGTATAGELDTGLEDYLANMDEGEIVSTLVVMTPSWW